MDMFFWVFWIIAIIAVCIVTVKENKDKPRSAIMGCLIIIVIFLGIPVFFFIGENKGSILLSLTGVFIFIGFIICGLIYNLISKRKTIKQLNDYTSNYYSGEVVDKVLSYSFYKRGFDGEITVNTKYRIVFKYRDENNEEKTCTTYEMYDVYELDVIENYDKKISIAVVKETCKIYDETLIKKLKEVKEMNDSLDI